MMKHDLEEQLEELERQGISRRHFLKILTAAGITTAVGVIISIIVYAVNNNMLTCLMIIAFAGMAAFIAVRRDNHNENMIYKILQIYRYSNAQKRFEYEYMGIRSPWEDGQ